MSNNEQKSFLEELADQKEFLNNKHFDLFQADLLKRMNNKYYHYYGETFAPWMIELLEEEIKETKKMWSLYLY